MSIRLLLSGFAACIALCALPQTAGAKIFPQIFVTTSGGRLTAAASPFGGSGTIDLSDPNVDSGRPERLFKNLAMPRDIAVSDDIIYAVIGGKGVVSAFSTSGNPNPINNNVATVPKTGANVGIAAFDGNVFVADSRNSTIRGYNSLGEVVASFNDGVNHPTEITLSEGNLFVVNHGTGKTGEYITRYDAASGTKLDGNLIQGLHGRIEIAVAGTDLFLMHVSTGGFTIDELNLTTNELTSNFITGLNRTNDVAAFGGQLFVTDVPNQSIDVYNIATGDLVRQISGLHGGPQGIDIVPGGTVPDLSSTWLLLLLAITAAFGFKIIFREPA